MSDQTKTLFKKAATVIGLISAIGGLGIWSVFLIPYRLDAAEEKVKAHSTQISSINDSLIRLEEASKHIQEQLKEIKEQIRKNN